MSTELSFQISRATVQQTHRAMRDEILSALEPVLFGPLTEGKRVVRTLETGIWPTGKAALRQRSAFGDRGSLYCFACVRSWPRR